MLELPHRPHEHRERVRRTSLCASTSRISRTTSWSPTRRIASRPSRAGSSGGRCRPVTSGSCDDYASLIENVLHRHGRRQEHASGAPRCARRSVSERAATGGGAAQAEDEGDPATRRSRRAREGTRRRHRPTAIGLRLHVAGATRLSRLIPALVPAMGVEPEHCHGLAGASPWATYRRRVILRRTARDGRRSLQGSRLVCKGGCRPVSS